MQPSFILYFNYLNAIVISLFTFGSDGKASVYNAGDLGLIPGSGRSIGERNGNPLQSLRINPGT